MQAWSYTLIPAAAAVVGAAAAVNLRPGPVLVSAIQHFAAGVVFAAAAGEILPDLKHAGSPWAMLAGGALGVAAMLLVRILEKRVKGPAGLMSVTGIDILVDGLVLGIAFAAGAKAGILLTVALTIEVLFLGLTVANELGEGGASKGKVVGLTAALVLLLPLGALLGGPVGSLPAAVQAGFLSFGLIALLYLVTEELLVEAHETEDRPWVTAMFFAGFLLLLLLDGMIG
ncbi:MULTISPECIES: transporter [Methylobacterium]|jgi:ZIP family zinc transporter|uniref:Transporter n=1 Tax=Methylobacterium ajmalii TaxID=2738439 RepID=A0ABU9ZZ37_9HYPH|nr:MULTISPECIES: transporter [Methylobacterium]MBZ6412660.1 transporter [Methylobacterium sp.]MBK3398484.1 transporter [Methylobacterium ajmalii]MBK3407684.1 transporter [Methylobacterium ajmalii]MBK3422172.1 transporter [Methylobacterium ajmalii]NGM33750.1 transporter [Methylobacterium sp. DB0501]